MKKILLILGMFLGVTTYAHAFFIDFEDGTDGDAVNDIVGISFQSFNGFDAIYGDTCAGGYNTSSDDGGCSNNGGFHHKGDKWLWASPQATAQGVIVDFTNNDGTWFQTGYSVNSTSFYFQAFFTDGTDATVVGAQNYGGPMDFARNRLRPPNNMSIYFTLSSIHSTHYPNFPT